MQEEVRRRFLAAPFAAIWAVAAPEILSGMNNAGWRQSQREKDGNVTLASVRIAAKWRYLGARFDRGKSFFVFLEIGDFGATAAKAGLQGKRALLIASMRRRQEKAMRAAKADKKIESGAFSADKAMVRQPA